jgi:hypothetical protein
MWAETYTRPGTGAPASNNFQVLVKITIFSISAKIHLLDYSKFL